jgi:hypothetical protein
VEKSQGNLPNTDNRGNVNPSSVGVWSLYDNLS